ncbi:hypothetical protein [Aquimarina sp. AU58]|uniref:hypothetical protein n=1 Tax=Aquimarina sp. AU58 TaxID=1874112 RepID=UPI000D6DF2E9|nr:hypothetical protein [Aquimarina sp. AU58]
MSKYNYENKLAILQAIPSANIKIANIPIDVYLQEAEDLYLWVQEDKKDFLNINFDWQRYVDDLTKRTGALRYAQSLWIRRKNGQEESQTEWKQKLPIAYELRKELLADFRYAFRNHKELISAIRDIAKGKSYADLIQDLSSLSVLGKSNVAKLKNINFDLQKLDHAEQLSKEMAQLLAQVNSAIKQSGEVVKTRNQSYTHLKEAVDEIRNAGKYIFKNNPNRFKGYISTYRKS